jgi:hypothetical protein
MIKRCSNCGAFAPDDVSVFCNRCGARLPAVMSCRQCGKPVTDPQSRFCDRCGSPLVPPVQAAVPPITLTKGKICLACGFENFTDHARFCKKCGNILGNGGDTGTGPDHRPQERPAGTMPGGRGAVRQEPGSMPVAARPGPGTVPVALSQKPVSRPGAVQDVPRESRQDGLQKEGRRSYRNIALAAAVIILILIVVAVVFIGVRGKSGDSPANATAPDLLGTLPLGILSGYAPVINQSTPVITDTPLTVK